MFLHLMDGIAQAIEETRRNALYFGTQFEELEGFRFYQYRDCGMSVLSGGDFKPLDFSLLAGKVRS